MLVMNLYIYLLLLAISVIGFIFPKILIVLGAFALFKIVQIWLNSKNFTPQSREFKEIEKLKRKRQKKLEQKHRFINDQIAYIDEIWGYNKSQKDTIEKFLEQRAYGKIYNKLTASLLPQLILLIEECNNKNQKGCKQEVNRRIRELTEFIKIELKKTKNEKYENFETSLEVYDYLIKEVK